MASSVRRTLRSLEGLKLDESGEDVMKMARNTIIILAAQSGENIDRTTLNHKGNCFFEAVHLLCKDDVIKTLVALKTILTTTTTHGRSKIELKLPIATVSLHILDLNIFRVIAIIALNYIPSSVTSVDEGPSLVLNIFHHLFSFMKAKSPYSVFITKTAYMLMRKYLTIKDVGERASECLTLGVTSTFMMLSPYSKAVGYLEKMCEIIVKNWPHTRIICELIHLSNVNKWSNYDCYLVSTLIKLWPPNHLSLKFLEATAERLSIMLTQKDVGSGAMKVFAAALNHLNLTTWNSVFVPRLIKVMPNDPVERRAYMKSTLSDCVSLAVKHFGGKVLYDEAVTAEVDLCYTILVLYCGVHQGSMDVQLYQQNIERILTLQNSDIIRNYAFKIVCISNNKRIKLQPWQLKCVKSYLEQFMFDIDIDCSKDLHYLFSQIWVRGNDILASECNEDSTELERYVEFMQHVYTKCIENLKSKAPGRIAVAATIFNLARNVFEEGLQCLKTKYKLPKAEHFEQKVSLLLKHLNSKEKWPFTSAATWKTLCEEFINNSKVYSEIPGLIVNWCNSTLPRDAKDIKNILAKGITLFRNQHDYESIEKACYCIVIGVSDESLFSHHRGILINIIKNELLSKDIVIRDHGDLMVLLLSSSLFGLTICTSYLLKLQFIEVKDSAFIHKIFNHCEDFIKKVIRMISCEVAVRIYSTVHKIIEHTLIASLDIMSLIVNTIAKLNSDLFKRALEAANTIIETSNMKRPVTAAAVKVRQICMKIRDASELQVLIIKFLEYILGSIYSVPNCWTSKIRRNPEHRLMIHAIVVADERPNHPFLARAMEFLQGVLSDPSSPSSSIVSALHTVEIILSDTYLRNSTTAFIIPISIYCLNEFSNKDWQIRNASVQVLQALVTRILGQKTNSTHRRNSIEDVFLLFPKLALYFYSKLLDSHIGNVQESVIAILAVFSESHRKSNLFLCKDVNFIIDCFLKIFLNLICSDTSTVRIFAAKAYVALYPHVYIPFIICDIVEWLRLNFCKISKNIFYTCHCLLQELYEKFNVFYHLPYYKVGLGIIEASFQNLALFLKEFNIVYELSLFSLLGVKSKPIAEIEKAVRYQLQERTYQSRLWLYNNVPYVLSHVDIKEFPNMLRTCLDGTLSLHLKLHCLRTIIIRYNELVKCSLVNEILLIVILSFFKLPNSIEYLVSCYSHIILLLFEVGEFAVTQDLLIKLRDEYRKVDQRNIYFISIYVSLLSCVRIHTDADQIFLKSAIATYKNATIIEDFELNFHVCSSLKYLYKCVQISERHHLLKLAFILLLNQETCFEICKFIAHIFAVEFCSTYETLQTLLSFKHLVSQLGNEVEACTFLLDITIFVSSLEDIFQDDGSFYMKQNSDICLHKHYLKQILLEKVKSAFRLIPRRSCIDILCNASYTLTV